MDLGRIRSVRPALIQYMQGFIQAILMFSSQHKKLNLLIEFSNEVFKLNFHEILF